MTCAKIIFEDCLHPKIYYLIIHSLHRNEVGAYSIEREICCIIIDVMSCKGGGIVMACSTLTKSYFTQQRQAILQLFVNR